MSQSPATSPLSPQPSHSGMAGTVTATEISHRKPDRYLTDPEALMVEINDPGKPTAAELGRLRDRIQRNNFVFYQVGDNTAADAWQSLCSALGLTTRIPNPAADSDHVSRITATDDAASSRYIPYTRRELKWHTDGYYNSGQETVGAFVLHCDQHAFAGGANQFLDHELVYSLLHDSDPALVAALSEPDVFTVPANIVDSREIRAQFTGPVFATDVQGDLIMRYSERTRHMSWRDNQQINRALAAIRGLLQPASEWMITHTLSRGQGVICNNTLHRRDAFEDGEQPSARRCLKRIRFQDRVRSRA